MRREVADVVDVDRFRFGSAVALGVLAMTALLAFDPGDADADGSTSGRTDPVFDGGDGVADGRETADERLPWM